MLSAVRKWRTRLFVGWKRWVLNFQGHGTLAESLLQAANARGPPEGAGFYFYTILWAIFIDSLVLFAQATP